MKNDNKEVRQAMANTDEKKAKRRALPSEASGTSVNPNAMIVLADDYDIKCHGTLPKQVRLAMSIVWTDFDGQCTLAQLDKAWTEKHMDEGGNGGTYTQGVIGRLGAKSFFTHYFSGSDATIKLTSRKGGLTNEQYKQYIAIS